MILSVSLSRPDHYPQEAAEAGLLLRLVSALRAQTAVPWMQGSGLPSSPHNPIAWRGTQPFKWWRRWRNTTSGPLFLTSGFTFWHGGLLLPPWKLCLCPLPTGSGYLWSTERSGTQTSIKENKLPWTWASELGSRVGSQSPCLSAETALQPALRGREISSLRAWGWIIVAPPSPLQDSHSPPFQFDLVKPFPLIQ